MIEHFEIKIVRMKSGEDIIAFVYEDFKNKKVYLKLPKLFYTYYDSDIDEEELHLTDWITPKAFAYQEINFSDQEILFTTYANTVFGHQYLDTVLNEINPESDLAIQIKKSIDTIFEEEIQTPSTTLH